MISIKLTCKPIFNGIMAYWDKKKDAAQYIITLYIDKRAISVRTNPRTELYCSFTGLASLDGGYALSSNNDNWLQHANRLTLVQLNDNLDTHYYVQVQAENRNGEIIAQSEKVMCKVKEL